MRDGTRFNLTRAAIATAMDPSCIAADGDDARNPIVVTSSGSTAGPAMSSGESGERHLRGG